MSLCMNELYMSLQNLRLLSSPLPLLSLSSPSPLDSGLNSRVPKGPYGRAPKGDGGLNSRACLRILSLGVEYLSSPLGSST